MADIKFRFGYKSYDVCGGDGGGGAVLMTEEVKYYMYVCK